MYKLNFMFCSYLYWKNVSVNTVMLDSSSYTCILILVPMLNEQDI